MFLQCLQVFLMHTVAWNSVEFKMFLSQIKIIEPCFMGSFKRHKRSRISAHLVIHVSPLIVKP